PPSTLSLHDALPIYKVRSHPAWNRQQLPFLADLQAAGCARETIDRVVCTHLHVDHVGWNTMLERDKWVPTFPGATYLIGGTEWEDRKSTRLNSSHVS